MTNVNSESDNRTVNNTVRHKYRVLTEEEKAQMQSIKDKGADFIKYLDEITPVGRSRETSIAITKMEEAVMWAVKHVTA